MKKIFKYLLWIICISIILYLFNTFSHFNNKAFDNIIYGLYASTVTVFIFEILNQIKMKRNYKYLEGNDWKEFYPPDFDFEPNYNFSNETGNVIIKYLEENILSIRLIETDSKKNWYGNITMNKDNIKTGRVSWKYEPENFIHHFGLKELIVTEDDDWDYIYLMSVNLGLKQVIDSNIIVPIFGNAVLRRKKIRK